MQCLRSFVGVTSFVKIENTDICKTLNAETTIVELMRKSGVWETIQLVSVA